jgi:hypothetical protein
MYKDSPLVGLAGLKRYGGRLLLVHFDEIEHCYNRINLRDSN